MERGAQADDIVRDFYDRYYSSVVSTANGSLFERYMHRCMEVGHRPRRRFSQVLEVGGNKGEHIRYVTHEFDSYLLTDLHRPDPGPDVLADARVQVAQADVMSLPFASASFDRVISTCLLHHVPSPWTAVAEMQRVTRPGGIITLMVPTDPGLAYRVGKALTSGRQAKRHGLADEFRLVSAVDHRNHFRSIKAQVEQLPDLVSMTTSWRPFRVPSAELNAFAVMHLCV